MNILLVLYVSCCLRSEKAARRPSRSGFLLVHIFIRSCTFHIVVIEIQTPYSGDILLYVDALCAHGHKAQHQAAKPNIMMLCMASLML